MSESFKINLGVEEEAKKALTSKIDFGENIQRLIDVKNSNPLKELTVLCDEIIRFYEIKQKMLEENYPIEEERSKFLYQLNEKTEQLLIETIYMENKDNQNSKILKIYNWYMDKFTRFQDLKKISERTEKEWYQEDEEEVPIKTEPVSIQEMKKHRCHIGGFESAGKRLTAYKTKKIRHAKALNKISFQDENLNFYGKTFGYNTMTNFAPINNINIPSYVTNSQQSTKYGTFYNKGKSKQEINTGTDWFSRTGLDFRKENKESYSFIRPPNEYEFLQLEKNIINEKHKQLAEKRNMEEITNGVLEHGFRKSFYKGSVNQKTEMKNMINKYKDLLEVKRQEEEKRCREEEARRKIEQEKLRKELEIKKQIAMSKIRQIKKSNPNRKIVSYYGQNESKEKNEETEKQDEEEGEKEEKEENEEENEEKEEKEEEKEEEEKEEEKENMTENNSSKVSSKLKINSEKEESNEVKEEEILINRVDVDNIKYISPFMNEEDITNENPFKKTDEMKEVVFYEIKGKEQGIAMREKASRTQYNFHKKKQLELEMNAENDNTKNVAPKVNMPSNLSSYFLFSDKIFFRRNLGKTMNNFKLIDMPKDRYQDSLSPLSFFDNKHKEFRQNLKYQNAFGQTATTHNYAMRTFYRFKDNFLQVRKSLSAHKIKTFQNTLLYKNSKPKFRIKLDNMVNIPNDKNKFAMYYLPNTKNQLIDFKFKK